MSADGDNNRLTEEQIRILNARIRESNETPRTTPTSEDPWIIESINAQIQRDNAMALAGEGLDSTLKERAQLEAELKAEIEKVRREYGLNPPDCDA